MSMYAFTGNTLISIGVGLVAVAIGLMITWDI